ncbi:MAG: 2-amino-4-hydroxy-6-hydroxymethyldihydropteridine diphosphokinase [Betaproteobacteria bacterium]|nr:2-amino-4-hydroxy-6-hydroxymethyldihydropteridine diphosphokinase [Betaproteobacteria bacterium]
MSTTTRAYVGLGSNIESPGAQLGRALEALAALPHTRILARSSFYRTAPVGFGDQPDFVNAVVLVDTSLSAHALLAALLAIERAQGRVRGMPNGPRTLDLDILLYDDLVLRDSELTLPHPRMHERAFVLVPLAELAPDLVVPGRGVVRELAWRSAAHQMVERIDADSLA